jgi:hypothetical protein
MATAKKKSSQSDKNLIFGNVEKNAFFHKVLSRVPKLKVGTVSVFFFTHEISIVQLDVQLIA